MSRQSHLNTQQRVELWQAVTEAYDGRKEGASLRSIRRNARKKLAGFGWEAILISIAAKILTNLILKWLENRREKAPKEQPAGFASEPLLAEPSPEFED